VQFVVDKRYELVQRRSIATAPSLKQTGDIVSRLIHHLCLVGRSSFKCQQL
jgi:hypothetical protein